MSLFFLCGDNLATLRSPGKIFGEVFVGLRVTMTRNFVKPLEMLSGLPVLRPTRENRDLFPEWHAYFERVYGHPVRCDIDLNSFSFFYNDSPLGVPTKHNVWPRANQAWTSFVPYFPEHYVGAIGYFVKRPPAALPATGRVEVMRVAYANADFLRGVEWLEASRLRRYGESKVSWFFVVVGSGVYIDIADRRTAVMRDRDEWPLEIWRGESDEDVMRCMAAMGVDAILFKGSKGRGGLPPLYSLYFFTHERAELVVRAANSGGSCPSLRYYAGWRGSVEARPNYRCAFANTGVCPAARPVRCRHPGLARAAYLVLILAFNLVSSVSEIVGRCVRLPALCCVLRKRPEPRR